MARRKQAETGTVEAIESYCTELDGVPVFVRRGDRLPADHPAVRDLYCLPAGHTVVDEQAHRTKHNLVRYG